MKKIKYSSNKFFNILNEKNYNNFILNNFTEEAFLTIFLFCDGPTIFNVLVTCKYFNWFIENSPFWKLYLKEMKSWKELCKKNMTYENVWLNLDKRSENGLKNQINNSPILKFFKDICIKVSDMGYWGIYFRGKCYTELDTVDVLKWRDNKEITWRHFDFYRDNKNNRYFNSREIYNNLLNYDTYNESDFFSIREHLRGLNISFIFNNTGFETIECFISWEKKKEKVYKKKSQNCLIF
jgi:hypothetical protein